MKWPVAADWPNAAWSKKIYCAPHRWHLQRAGTGPIALILHGAGGSTHSMAALFDHMSRTHDAVAVDLPGHGYTQLGARHRSGLEPMAQDLATLCQQEGWAPALIIGHSAGAAVALDLSQRMTPTPQVIGINAALSQFSGIAGALFPALAKALAAMPFTATLFSGIAGNAERVQALIRGTGSSLTERQLSYYTRLVADRDHVDGALLMMSQWALDPLLSRFETVTARALLITGAEDRTVPPEVSAQAVQRLPHAEHVQIAGLGHLMHEEAPDQVACEIERFLGEGG